MDFAKTFDTVPIKDFNTAYSGMVSEAIAISDGFNPSSPSEHTVTLCRMVSVTHQ